MDGLYDRDVAQWASEQVRAEIAEARELASRSLSLYGETPRVAVDTLRYNEEQVLGDWFPPII
jgi:hypothetical protein